MSLASRLRPIFTPMSLSRSPRTQQAAPPHDTVAADFAGESRERASYIKRMCEVKQYGDFFNA